MVFDGVKFAAQIEKTLPKKSAKLVVVLDPKNLAGGKYVELKGHMAKRLGVGFEVYENPDIQKWNDDASITGIMIQLPYPNSEKLIDTIDPKKDVDGLRNDSPYMPATVRAVVEILGNLVAREVCIVGSKGEVGSRLVKWIPNAKGMDKDDFDVETMKNADVIISATGQTGLIQPSMVKDGYVAIDVGYPKPEFTSEAVEKSRWYTPVPGGVGPVTVVMLFKNLLMGMVGS